MSCRREDGLLRQGALQVPPLVWVLPRLPKCSHSLLVEDLHLDSSLCHLANPVCKRPIHACGHLYNCYYSTVRVPLFAGHRPKAFERVVGSSSMLWEYLHRYSHLFHLDRKDRSEVFYDLFGLLLSALVGI